MTGGGIAAALGAAACYEVAYVLQALEARAQPHERALRASLLGALLRRRRWLAGAALSVSGAALQVLALHLAPLAVVQPTLALGLVLLLALAHVVLGEPVGRRELAAVAVVVAGVAVVAACAPGHGRRADVGLDGAAVLAALGAVLAAPFVLRGGRARPRLAVLAAGAGDAGAALALALVAQALGDGRLLLAAAWVAGAAGAGALALTAEMSALGRLAASRVAPVVVGAQVVLPVAAAPALTGEHWGSTPLGGALLGAGVLAVAAGAATLGASRSIGELRAGRAAAQALEHDVGG